MAGRHVTGPGLLPKGGHLGVVPGTMPGTDEVTPTVQAVDAPTSRIGS